MEELGRIKGKEGSKEREWRTRANRITRLNMFKGSDKKEDD